MGGRLSKILAFVALAVAGAAVLVGALQQGGGPNPVTDPAAWAQWAGDSPINALLGLIAAAGAAIGAVGALLQIFGPKAETRKDAAKDHQATRGAVDDSAAVTQAMVRDLQAQIAALAAAQGRPVDAETEARAGAALTAVARSDAPDLAAARQAIRDGDPEGVVDALIASTSREAAERLREAGDIAFAFDVDKALTAYQRAAAMEPDHFGTHINLSRLYRLAGNLAAARAAAQAALDHATDERDRSVALDQLGDVARAEGDLSSARTAYGEGLEIARRLSQHDPSNTEWLRDLSISHERLGDVLRAEGDLSSARTAYGEGQEIARRLTQRDPSNTQWQRDLSISHEKLGDVALAEGDLSVARTAYGEHLEISRRLTQRDPSNTQSQRDLSISHARLGEVARAEGDREGAAAQYRQGLAIAERLAAKDPRNAQWAADLAYFQGRLAE